jgi:hypothetical protein
MKRLLPVLLGAALVVGCDTTVRRSEVESVDYGPKPARWQEEIKSYLRIRLTDPGGAIIEFRTEPKQLYQRHTAVRSKQWGWAVCVWVNDRNQSGAYDGFYPVTFFLRDEKIVAVNNGPDDFGVIGAQYAREQCAELGAPFTQQR